MNSERDTLEIERIAGLDELDEFLDTFDLEKEDVCLVGSTCLAVRGLRENGDIDIMVEYSLRDRIDTSQFDYISLHRPRKYGRLHISDEDILTDSNLYDIVDGFKVMRPELYYSYKKLRTQSTRKRREKDYEDLQLLERYKRETEGWNDDLEVDNPRSFAIATVTWGIDTIRKKGIWYTARSGIPSFLSSFGPFTNSSDYHGEPTDLLGKARRSYRVDGPKKTLARGVNLVQLYEPTGLLDRYTGLRHKAKLGTLVDRKLDLQYPTGEFITGSYRGEAFQRMDVMVRLMAVESIKNDESIPDVVEKFEVITDQQLVDEVDETEGTSNVSKTPHVDPVKIGYDGSILTPNRLASALYHEPRSFPVSVESGSATEAYSLDWFAEHDFSQEQREAIESRYRQLLFDAGALFVFVLWPPAKAEFERIVEYIDELSNVQFSTDLTFEEAEFEEFVRDMYSLQTVRAEHIRTKIAELKKHEKHVIVGAWSFQTLGFAKGSHTK